MTDSKDSSLFGNDDELNSGKRHDDQYEPFAQPLPPLGEPLFPAASSAAPNAVSNGGWSDTAPDAVTVAGSETMVDLYGRNNYGQDNNSEFPTLYQRDNPYPNGNNARSGEAKPSSTDSTYPDPKQFEPTQLDPTGQDAPRPTYRVDENALYALPTQDQIAPDFATPAQHTHQHYAPDPNFPTGVVTSAVGVTHGFKGSHHAPSHKPVLGERELLFNRHFAVLTDLMQHGAWPQALEKLQAMRVEFPDVESLEGLLDEATLKSELMAQWTHKIKGRRLTVGQEWLIRRSLPFLLLLALFVSGTVFYQSFVAPSRQVVAMERANQALVEEATGLLQVGQIDEAINLYNLVLSRNPNFMSAQQGLADASRLSGLVVTYDIAIRVANSGNLERSLHMLQSVKTKSPSFRDIDARLARVNSLLQAEQAYELADRAFAQRRWMDAIAYYEQTRTLAADYQAVRVGIQLSAGYFLASQKLMTQWPTAEFGTQQIRDFLRVAQAVNGPNESIDTFLNDLDTFIKGERSLQNNNLASTVNVWGELYATRPSFFGGYLAEQLYRAYLALAAEVRTTEPEQARELYTLAAAMPVRDSSEARSQLQSLGATVPAAQPTPTPQPTVAFVAAAVAAPVAAVATPTPEPTPAPANPFQGWVVFRSTRGGFEQIFIMRADGSEQQLAPDEIGTRINAIYQESRRAPDGRLVFVQSATGRSDANIYVASSDGVNTNMVTDYNGDEYDPVWSPTGDRLAFVANHTGNDEIWTMRADGGDQRQLTSNNWEWDKHPTWSPDGSQIAFFSNRSGQRQIWVMSADGSNPRNLSNNTFDDWDPVWMK